MFVVYLYGACDDYRLPLPQSACAVMTCCAGAGIRTDGRTDSRGIKGGEDADESNEWRDWVGLGWVGSGKRQEDLMNGLSWRHHDAVL